MAKQQKPENQKTTISVMKVDKQKLRKIANLKGRSKTGDIYESDTAVFTRILNEYVNLKGVNLEGKNVSTTYPVKQH